MRRAVAFLTPVGGAAVPSPAAVAWFPVVGALIGAAVGVVWWGAGRVWAPVLAAALAVTADLILTGGLHADGLVDSADGLVPHLDRERRLEVMADPRAGAFGVTALVVVVLLRWAALATMAPSVGLVAGLWCLSRTVMAVALRTLPYVRAGGLAQSFRGGSAATVGVTGCALTVVLLAGAGEGPAAAVASVTAALAAAGAVLLLAGRRLGGYTGDVLGAAGLVAETAGLVAAAARW